MGTRAAIARSTNDEGGFEGRYHHWDGYPTGLGATLFEAYNGYFQRDLNAMLKYLVDDHPAGWSTINGHDLSLAPGFTDGSGSVSDPCAVAGCKYGRFNHSPGTYQKVKDHEYAPKPTPPECYCHGDRHEEAQLITEENASDCGCEYVYVLKDTPDGAVMLILSSYTSIGSLTGEKDQKMVGFFGMGDKDAVWKPIGVVGLDQAETPNFQKIEEEA